MGTRGPSKTHSIAQHGIHGIVVVVVVVVASRQKDEAGRVVGRGTGAMDGRKLRHGQKHRHRHRPKRTIKLGIRKKRAAIANLNLL